MKGYILDSSYQEGNITYVQKQTKYGTFEGKVALNSKDEDVASSMDGYRFAEQKCDIQAYRAKAKVMKERAKGIEHAYNVLWKSGVDAGDPVMQKLCRQIWAAWREYYKAKDTADNLEASYSAWVEFLQQSRRKIRQWQKRKAQGV